MAQDSLDIVDSYRSADDAVTMLQTALEDYARILQSDDDTN